jgi:hypothetical protein
MGRHLVAAGTGTEAGVAVVPAHESAVRRLRADATGTPYCALASLVEAQDYEDGVVVLEGDLGGQVYAVVPAHEVRCSEAALRGLLADLDARARPGPAVGDADLYFERHAAGARIAGGAGGGVVLPGGWVNDEFVQAGLDRAVLDVVRGRRRHLGPPG